jgi:hypothetical protein
MVLAACEMGAAPTKPTLVEVWVVGDDVYTLNLRDALEGAFRSSPDFTLSIGKMPSELVVLIPRNVGWKKIGGRTRVIYTVEFKTIDGRKIGVSTGSCWSDVPAKCATKIVRDAKIAARKIR